MTDHSPRPFADDAAIRRVGEGLLARTLPRAEWTHEAHLATCLWLLRERPDIMPATALRGLISGYNEAVGGANDDTQGYHETITQCFLLAVRRFLMEAPATTLVEAVNGLLCSPYGARNWPLGFYSRERLFSVAARRAFIAPDLAPLPGCGGTR